jgi:Rps23 Pro-64 3,4-dihydroxylase Tpa1-like proline 4-hydroxylase
MTSMVSAEVVARQHALALAFAQAKPFRHVTIEGFLDAESCAALLAGFPDFEARHALNEMGEVGGKAVRMDVRELSPAYRELDYMLRSRGFLDLMSTITGIPDLLYDPDYIGGGTHENRHGQALDPHIDFNYHPRTRWHRRLNLIIYLNHEWEDAWGGQLQLHSDPWHPERDQVVSVPPLFNHAVVFETNEVSWHGFSAIDLPEHLRGRSRKSFAIYLYTETRPAAETVPPHATVYVPAAMPEDWREGRVIDAQDLRELQMRFTRLRSQLRYLYEREKHFGAQVSALESALSEARAGQRLPLQGYATQAGGCTGLWPDGWAGQSLTASFTPTRRASELVLSIWVPDQISGGQTLAIELADSRSSHRLPPGRLTELRLPLRAKAGSPVPLRIEAATAWSPARSADSADERELAYKLVDVTLVH